jgi:hypothetical protein
LHGASVTPRIHMLEITWRIWETRRHPGDTTLSEAVQLARRLQRRTEAPTCGVEHFRAIEAALDRVSAHWSRCRRCNNSSATITSCSLPPRTLPLTPCPRTPTPTLDNSNPNQYRHGSTSTSKTSKPHSSNLHPLCPTLDTTNRRQAITNPDESWTTFEMPNRGFSPHILISIKHDGCLLCSRRRCRTNIATSGSYEVHSGWKRMCLYPAEVGSRRMRSVRRRRDWED